MIFIRSLGRLAPIRKNLTAAAAPFSTTTTIATTSATTTPINKQQQLLDIKDSCLNRLRQILDNPQEEFLRIQVETGGCSGFSYLFDIETNSKLDPDEDLIFDRDNYRIVISKEILPYMKGSSIEFTESLIKSSFQIINPVAETKCSCGSSFSIDFKKLQKPSSADSPL